MLNNRTIERIVGNVYYCMKIYSFPIINETTLNYFIACLEDGTMQE